MSEKIAVFAGGCFWQIEEAFSGVKGVVRTRVGYTGGSLENPTYEDVCTGRTGHAEAVEVTFAPEAVTYEELLREFFGMHDPTTADRQGSDIGDQYRPVVFCTNEEQKAAAEKFIDDLRRSDGFSGREIVTRVSPLGKFWEAEEYHQKYLLKLRKQGLNPECRLDNGKNHD